MKKLFGVLGFLGLSFSTIASAQRVPADSATLARLVATEIQFFLDWRAAWMSTESVDREFARRNAVARASRRPTLDVRYARLYRQWDIWCALANAFPYPAQTGYSNAGRIIESSTRPFSTCPSWDRSDSLPPDSFLHADTLAKNALTGGLLERRHLLVAALDSAAQLFPSNLWIAGQRVRFRVDALDYSGAVTAARTCAAERWWCAGLAGYAFAAQGNVASADSAFAIAVQTAPPAQRCTWNDIGMLLAPKERQVFSKLSCASRDSLGAIAMWLADPLYAEGGNARRVEHYSRRMITLLRSAVPVDEIYNWHPKAGGDALTELVMRYGLPSAPLWGGRLNDNSFDQKYRDLGAAAVHPIIVPEYDRDHLHFLPSLDLVLNPFSATRMSWTLSSTDKKWWPAELYRPSRSFVEVCDDQVSFLRRDSDLVTLAESQTAVIRREKGAVLAFATDLSRLNIGQRLSDSVDVMLLRTPAPDVIERLATQRTVASGRATLRSMLPAIPALIAIEIPNEGTRFPAVRTRFGIAPPPPLTTMKADEKAISDPILLAAPADGIELSNSADTVLAHMLGSTRLLPGTSHIGVFWETYGFAATDSVTITLQLQRSNGRALSRLGVALRVTSDKGATVQASWNEPSPADRGRSEIIGRIPVIGRSVTLDISALPSGEYTLEVSVAKKGERSVASRREFRIG